MVVRKNNRKKKEDKQENKKVKNAKKSDRAVANALQRPKYKVKSPIEMF